VPSLLFAEELALWQQTLADLEGVVATVVFALVAITYGTARGGDL
jgi:hypothetical protein